VVPVAAGLFVFKRDIPFSNNRVRLTSSASGVDSAETLVMRPFPRPAFRNLGRASFELRRPRTNSTSTQILFHDQAEDSDGDRTRQREGWPAANGA